MSIMIDVRVIENYVVFKNLQGGGAMAPSAALDWVFKVFCPILCELCDRRTEPDRPQWPLLSTLEFCFFVSFFRTNCTSSFQLNVIFPVPLVSPRDMVVRVDVCVWLQLPLWHGAHVVRFALRLPTSVRFRRLIPQCPWSQCERSLPLL